MSLREVSRLFYQLKLVNQELISKFEKETSFSITRFELMMFLKEHGPCCQTRLQKELKIDRAAVTRHLRILEGKKYVIRKRNKENNREVLVTITDKALNDLNRCQQSHCQSEQQRILPLSKDETQRLIELLTKLIQ
ncbi:MarR family winged helix-turn-helix transcriptional regulator [Facklamia sp. P12945]|uniref:MarR family winged helix-turn-helix transcriptional regulator n=1 Tax=unclassified Facklamia TaxID=2622293 RepID=UPI003D18597E